MPVDFTSQSDVFKMILPIGNITPASVKAGSVFGLPEQEWETQPSEGQLAVDVLETTSEVIIIAPMAGAEPHQVEVFIHNDLVTIRGVRQLSLEDCLPIHQECFWGKFSRTIVLPVDVHGERAVAEYHHGILSIHIPKRAANAKIPVQIVDE